MVAPSATGHAITADAVEFIRFCYARRRVGWPELYDEMCAVAGRGLYRGYGPEELAEIGIGFGLFQMPALANIVARVVAEDAERRRLAGEPVRTAVVVTSRGRHVVVDPSGSSEPEPVDAAPAPLETRTPPEPADRTAPEHGSIRIAVAAAGA